MTWQDLFSYYESSWSYLIVMCEPFRLLAVHLGLRFIVGIDMILLDFWALYELLLISICVDTSPFLV